MECREQAQKLANFIEGNETVDKLTRLGAAIKFRWKQLGFLKVASSFQWDHPGSSLLETL